MEGASPVVKIRQITRQALGRTAWLGDLYNARTDEFCSSSIFKEQLPTDSPAITTLENHQSRIDSTESDGTVDNMIELDVDLQLKLSILAGIVTPPGLAKYLQTSEKSSISAERSFACKITTVTEQLDLKRKEIEEMTKTKEELASTGATHVVVQIDWGAKCFVSVTDHNHKNNDKTKAGENISDNLEKLKSVGWTAGTDFEQGGNELSLKIVGDVLPDDLPTTVDDGEVEQISIIQRLVKECNGGKGKPVTLHMLPLLSLTEPFQEVSERDVFRVERLFSHIEESKQKASEFNFKEKDLEKVRRCKENITRQEDGMRCDIKKCVLDIRSAKCDSECLTKICEEYEGKVDEAFRALEEMSCQNISLWQRCLQFSSAIFGRDDMPKVYK